jgi:hypothetical protein
MPQGMFVLFIVVVHIWKDKTAYYILLQAKLKYLCLTRRDIRTLSAQIQVQCASAHERAYDMTVYMYWQISAQICASRIYI